MVVCDESLVSQDGDDNGNGYGVVDGSSDFWMDGSGDDGDHGRLFRWTSGVLYWIDLGDCGHSRIRWDPRFLSVLLSVEWGRWSLRTSE